VPSLFSFLKKERGAFVESLTEEKTESDRYYESQMKTLFLETPAFRRESLRAGHTREVQSILTNFYLSSSFLLLFSSSAPFLPKMLEYIG
jgi:hypothetical protein